MNDERGGDDKCGSRWSCGWRRGAGLCLPGRGRPRLSRKNLLRLTDILPQSAGLSLSQNASDDFLLPTLKALH